MKLNSIFEDKHIIVIEKPFGVPCQGDKTGDEDLLTGLNSYLKEKYHKVNDTYLGLIHRLDRPVGGVIVFAKTKESNANLSKQIQDRTFKKEYLVIVCGKPEETSGELIHYLKKFEKENISKVVSKETTNAKEAILEYELLSTVCTEELGELSLLKIQLKTGRHHQIRAQLSAENLPIWGDTKYNPLFSKNKEWTKIALWSYKVSFSHPITKKIVEFSILPDREFPWSLFEIKE